jgi:peptidoglycan/xylan/chitin deacetylase (PgdA/CDA1 family)
MSEANLAPRQLNFIYHELQPGGSRYSYVVSTELFKAHLSIFAGLRKMSDRHIDPKVTFDDGHLSDYEHALPLLESQNLKATFFITAGWTGRRSGYMGWSEIKSLEGRGHIIGAHGLTHMLLTQCTTAQLNSELRDSKAVLESALGKAVTAMSLPGGRYNSRVISACEDAGYTHIYTSAPQPEPVPLPLLVGRLNILGNTQPQWLARLLASNDSLLSSLRRRYRIKLAVREALGDNLYEKLWSVINRKTQHTVDDGGVWQ